MQPYSPPTPPTTAASPGPEPTEATCTAETKLRPSKKENHEKRPWLPFFFGDHRGWGGKLESKERNGDRGKKVVVVVEGRGSASCSARRMMVIYNTLAPCQSRRLWRIKHRPAHSVSVVASARPYRERQSNQSPRARGQRARGGGCSFWTSQNAVSLRPPPCARWPGTSGSWLAGHFLWVLVWTGACFWHGVGGFMFNSSSSERGFPQGETRLRTGRGMAVGGTWHGG